MPRGFDYRRRRPWLAWGAEREWPPLNPIPADPNTYVYISSDHTTDPPPDDGGDTFTSDFWPMPSVLHIGDPSQPLGSAFTRTELAAFGVSNAWPSANRAIFWPITITEDFTVAKMIVHSGDAAAGNMDLGIYSLAGARLASSGSTGVSGTNVLQVATVSYTLAAGSYLAAMASDTAGATQHWRSATFGDQERTNIYGMAMMNSAFPLPATATFAEVAAGTNLAFHVALAKTGAFL